MLLGWILADLLWWRGADRCLRPLRGVRVWRGVLGVFVAFQALYIAILLSRSFFDHVPEVRPVYWAVCAYVWHLFLLPGSVLVYFGNRGVRWIRRKRAGQALEQKPVEAEPKPGLTRRQVLAALGAALPPLITAGVAVAGTRGLGNFKVREVTLTLPTLPPDLDGLTIAQVSDLHIGRFLPAGTMERVAEATNAMQAELVVFTGDLLDVSCESVAPGLDFMRRLDRRHGLAMIEGNHDGMHGAEWFEGNMKAAGLPLLLDDTAIFKVPGRATPVQMMGITWGQLVPGSEFGHLGAAGKRLYRAMKDWTAKESIQRVIAKRMEGAFPILLAHHPHALDPAAEAGLPLVLSGHTHGGQIMLTKTIGAGPLRFKYWAGEYEKGASKLFVNNGVGNWFPLRVNAPAEIVKLTLRRG